MENSTNDIILELQSVEAVTLELVAENASRSLSCFDEPGASGFSLLPAVNEKCVSDRHDGQGFIFSS